MKFIDLFAGIGGIRLGMEQAGHTCAGWVEWDKFARKSYIAVHKPDGEFTETDINNVTSQELPKADCWCFGFPCQDISVAGKQGGFTNGKRSSLFFKVTGLIRELKEEDKPSYLFIENVKNLLSINKGWDFAKLLIEMDKIGYDVEWDVLNSAEVVPQHRERIFIIGHLRGRSTRKVFPVIRESETTNQKQSIETALNVIGNYGKDPKHHISERTRVFGDGKAPTIQASDYKQPKTIAVNQIGNIIKTKSFGGNPQVGRVYDPSGISPTLNTMTGGGREPKIINPLKGKTNNGWHFEQEVFDEKVISRALKAGGGSGNITKIIGDQDRKNKNVIPTDISPTLRAQSVDRHEILTKKPTVGNYKYLQIRKLTPRECWRLQGFPDWTFDKAQEVNSNSQLYKQAGNSVTVPVIKAIADRMELEE